MAQGDPRFTRVVTVFGGLHSLRPLPEASALVSVARAFTPRVEASAPTPVLLDLSGLGRLWPTPQALGRALLDAAAARAIEAQAALAARARAGRHGLRSADLSLAAL